MTRSNLTVFTGAQVQRLVMDGSRCRGAEYVKDGRTHVAWADGEVISCAGAIGSPRVLMLSGIGPAA